jgi:hypothetical protein
MDISCKDLQVFGGTIIGPPSLQMLRLFGTNSRKLSGDILFLPGLMAIKHTEFIKLTQGNKSLNECL